MKKTKISLFLVLCLALLMGGIPQNTEVSAESASLSETPVQITAHQGKYYYGDPADGIEIVQVWRTGDSLVEASIEDVMREHVEMEKIKTAALEEQVYSFSQDVEMSNNNPMAVLVEKYTENRNYEFRAPGERVTKPQYNPGPGTDSQSISWSASKSHQFSAGLTTGDKNAIKKNVSYTFVSSASTTETNILTVEPCYDAWFVFEARMRRSEGTIQFYDYDTDLPIGSGKVANVEYPVKLRDNLDGWIYSVKEYRPGCPKS